MGSSTARLIWAMHPQDPGSDRELHYHGPLSRGTRSVYLQEKPRPPRRSAPDLRIWEIRANNLMLPNDDHTHYWCQIFKAPDLGGVKHHMTGVSAERYHERFKPLMHHLKAEWQAIILLVLVFHSSNPSSILATRATCITWCSTNATCLARSGLRATGSRATWIPRVIGATRPTCRRSGLSVWPLTHGLG